jgi:hypothetical protein
MDLVHVDDIVQTAQGRQRGNWMEEREMELCSEKEEPGSELYTGNVALERQLCIEMVELETGLVNCYNERVEQERLHENGYDGDSLGQESKVGSLVEISELETLFATR